MAFWDSALRRSLILSGEVLVIRLTVKTENPQGDQFLWDVAREDTYRLREEIDSAIHEHMGPEFDVRSMSFAQGSLEMLVVIGTLYYAVSRYKSFVESVELSIAQLKRVVTNFFSRRQSAPLSVRATWSPGPGLAQAMPRLLDAGLGINPGIVVVYLILSHAAMLAVLLWLLVRALRH